MRRPDSFDCLCLLLLLLGLLLMASACDDGNGRASVTRPDCDSIHTLCSPDWCPDDWGWSCAAGPITEVLDQPLRHTPRDPLCRVKIQRHQAQWHMKLCCCVEPDEPGDDEDEEGDH